MERLGAMREIDQTIHFITYNNFTALLILPRGQRNELRDILNELANDKIVGFETIEYQTKRQQQIALNQSSSQQTITEKGDIVGSIEMPALISDAYIEILDDIGQKRRARVVNTTFSNDSIDSKFYHRPTRTTLTQLEAHRQRTKALMNRHITSIGW